MKKEGNTHTTGLGTRAKNCGFEFPGSQSKGGRPEGYMGATDGSGGMPFFTAQTRKVLSLPYVRAVRLQQAVRRNSEVILPK